MKRAYLIDPFIRKVSEVWTDASLDDLYKQLHCDMIQVAYPNNADGDMFILDEEGKFKKDQRYFVCSAFPGDILAGRALWIGQGIGGDMGSARASLKWVAQTINWVDAEEVKGPIL